MRTVSFLLRQLVSPFLLWSLMLLTTTSAFAATPGGTLIRSQAQAFFQDEFNQPVTVLSNEVTTLIQDVTGVRLDADQTRVGVEGQPVVFQHQLTNTGNTNSHFTLSLSGIEGRILLDRNLSGGIQGNPEVDGPVFLIPGASQSLLVEAIVPARDSTVFTLKAEVVECSGPSVGRNRCEDTNTDILKRTDGVVYEGTKAMSTLIAPTDNEVIVTLNFNRLDSNTFSSALTLIDKLPLGLVFNKESTTIEGGSEVCNVTGEQCQLLAPALVDNSTNTVTWKLTGDKEHEGKLRFAATVTGSAGTTIFNTGEYRFCKEGDALLECVTQYTNRVALQIIGRGVVLNGSSAHSRNNLNEPVIAPPALAGRIVDFTNYLWNTGTSNASYLVTLVDEAADTRRFPEGTTFCISATQMCSDFSETPEFRSEILLPGRSQTLFVRAQLPDSLSDEQLNQSYFLTLQARDTQDESITDRIINMLVAILSNVTDVDMTLNSPLGSTDAPESSGILGAGPGSDDVILTRITANVGETVNLPKIFVNNTGDITDQYRLILREIGEQRPPSGMSWRFMNKGNVPVVSTEMLPGDANQEFTLEMVLPKDVPPGVYPMKVLATSKISGQSDILPFELEIHGTQTVEMTPNGRSQVTPGSFVTFPHRLSNVGTVPVSSVELMLEDSLSGSGWQSLVYRDVDGSASLAGDDVLITAPVDLAPGEIVHLLVKVFAPANALTNSENITTLKASFVTDAPQILLVTDTAFVSNAQVEIVKTQAHWKSCAVPTPGIYEFSTRNFPVKPGECVVYRLEATNKGSEPVLNVEISDRSPDYTLFHRADFGGDEVLPRSSSGGAIEVSGQMIQATWKRPIAPGESVSLRFGVQVQ